MESLHEKRSCFVEKSEDKLPWLSVDSDTLVSIVVRLMLSIVVSCSISIIAFILKNDPRSYAMDVMSYIYVSVIMLWVSLMCLIFCRFILGGILKNKSPQIKKSFVFGIAVNLLALFAAVIYGCASYRNEVLLVVVMFIAVFNSMVMLMFHDVKVKMEEKKLESINSHKILEVPKDSEVKG